MKNLSTLFAILLVIFCTTSCEEFVTNASDRAVGVSNVRVEFLYFTPYLVEFSSTIDNWTPRTPELIGERTYAYSYRETSSQNLLSIKFKLLNPPPDYFDLTSWINGGGGIRYANVYINGQKLGNEYAIDNGLLGSNISFALDERGNPFPIGEPINPDPRIPSEVFAPKRLVQLQTPPADKPFVHGWLQVLHNNAYPNESSRIEVKSIKLFKYVNGLQDPILFYTYTYLPNSVFTDGGLYYRYPFYPPGDYHEPMTPYVNINSNGVAQFSPSDRKEKVWHFWHEPRVLFPLDAVALRLECEMRISGNCAVQAGADFKSQFSATGEESGAGDWYFQNSQWQNVVFDSK